MVVLFVALSFAMSMVNDREEYIPDREAFVSFPSEIGEWRGETDRLDSIYLDVLKLSDYALYDYIHADGSVINFYSAYYGSQRSGVSTHSPRTCIPGGGWKLSTIEKKRIDGVKVNSNDLHVNSVVIEKGGNKQLVYYWFQGRGRTVTNEYLVKWYLLIDSLTKNRTDGALVRITTPINDGDSREDAERRLHNFLKSLSGRLERYIPS
jgi:EpsI family protein